VEKNIEQNQKKYRFICPYNHILNSDTYGDGTRSCKICGREMKLEKIWMFKYNELELEGEESD